MKDQPLINAHSHIFTARDVPPFIAKKMVYWPLHWATYLPFYLFLYKVYLRLKPPFYAIRDSRTKTIGIIKSNLILNIIYWLIGAFLLTSSLIFIAQYFNINYDFFKKNRLISDYVTSLQTLNLSDLTKFWWVALAFLWSRFTRAVIWNALKTVSKPLTYLPKKETINFATRYFDIVELAKYERQATVYNKLYKMYPKNSKFVVLSMDMEFMGAGRPRPYVEQLEEIYSELINKGSNENYKNIIPFIFVDPRRVRCDNGNYTDLTFWHWINVKLKSFFNKKNTSRTKFFTWKFNEQSKKIELKDCLLKRYLEKESPEDTTRKFVGIKIYPALGYYPFDEDLLPLWLYCVQNNIPITTHCIIGTIFYRGRMKRKWFKHPVFQNDKGEKLDTYAETNYQLQRNFTHPLNYLALLEPSQLMSVLDNCREDIQKIFGYEPEKKVLARDLRKLKINLAHYGGVEQWTKYLNRDRDPIGQEIIETPERGIEFFQSQDGKKDKPNKPSWLWKRADWFSIISSLMLQYDNVYADISYILHNPKIKALLHNTLHNDKLEKKILFGTDYYVVRNHKSEKELVSDLFMELSSRQMHYIADRNPKEFLKTKFTDFIRISAGL